MSKGKIIVADDEKQVLDILGKTLSLEGYEVFKASDGKEVIKKLKEFRPDVILLDINMPFMDGFQVKSALNQNTSTASIPVIFLTARDTTTDKVEGLSLGVDDYLTKPVHLKELLARINSVLNRRRFYEDISMRDGLTGLYNINFFNEQISVFFNLAKRYGKGFSLAVIDVDDFKSINDTHGHITGDFVLKQLAEVMKNTLREADISVRYGGDEFVVIMPGISAEEAKKAMERLKSAIKDKEFIMEDAGKTVSFSISAGTAAYSEDMENETQVFEASDAAMYADKRARE